MIRTIVVAILAVLLAVPVANAQTPVNDARITLTPEIKQRLMALDPLRGDGVTADVFDGKPVLVTFFASW